MTLKKYLILGLASIIFVLASPFNFAGSSPISCHIEDQDGDTDFSFCRDSDSQRGSIRCYADITWTDHPKKIYRIWGDQCWSSYADCWWSGAGHLSPCHE